MSAVAVLYTDYTASGGQRLGTLLIEGGNERTRLDGNETTDLVVGRKRWTDLGGDVRMVVRLTWPDGTITERRISKVSTTDTAPTTQLELVPVFADLGTGGPIVRVVAGKVATRVAGELPVSVALSTYVTPHPAATRIGLAIGTIEKDVVVQFDLDAPTPAALIREVFDKAKLELELVRTSDSVWTLNGRAKRGSTVPALQVRESRNQSRLALGVDDQQLATVVVPLGDADPATGDRATMSTARWSVAGIASGWVQLRDPANGTATPILVDTQWQGAFVVDRFGFAQAILNARASDGAVQLANTAGLSVGSRVWIAANAAGTPLVEVYDASSVGARRRSVPLPLAGLRGEANELRNGRFLDGLAQWTGANPTTPPAFAEVPRNEFGVTRSGQANGARAAATGTGTPFAIKGLTPSSFVRQWAEIKVGGATLPVTADAIPDTSGALTLLVGGGGLPGSYPDNAPFTLIRRETRTLTLDGVQNPFSPYLKFRDTNTDGMFPNNAGTIASAVGGYTGAALFDYLGYFDNAGILAGRVLVNTGETLTWASFLQDVYIMAGTSLNYVVGASSGTFTFASMVAQVGGGTNGTIVVGSMVRTFRSNGQWQYLRVTAIAGSIYSFETIDGLPVVASGGFDLFQICNLLLADGSSWEFTAIRETRALLLNGAQSSGLTSVPFKAQTNIATRNWTASDTITMNRVITGTFDITSVGTVTENTYYDPDLDITIVTGYSLQVTFAAGTSTMDDLPSADWSSSGLTFQNGASAVWNLVDIIGTTAYFNKGLGSDAPLEVGIVSQTWTKADTYALSGTASWGANGRVTLTLASAIPTGRSYARGLPVNANWVTGAMRLHAARSGGNTTVELFGQDEFFSTSDPTSSARGALYRITANGSTLPIPGNTLYAASSAQADGGGNASVTLTAANANAIANNEAVTIVTPQLLRPSDDRLGSVVRMTSPVGGTNVPTASTPGLTPLAGIPIPVPAGTTVPVTVFATFALSQGVYALGQQPAIALVDGGGAILATARLATGSATVAQTPTLARLILTHVLTVPTTVSVRLFGGSSDRTLWTIALDAMLCVTDRDDVPFVVGSWANALTIRGAEELAARRDPAVAVQLDLATLRRWSDAPAGAPVVIGQTVTLPALGLTRRVLSIDRDVTDPTRVRVEIGVPTDDLSTQVGAS